AHYQHASFHAGHNKRERIRKHWPVQLNLQVRCPRIPDKHQTRLLESWQLAEIVLELVRFQVYGPRHHKDRPCRPQYLVRVCGSCPGGPDKADPAAARRHSERRCSLSQNTFAWNVGAQLKLRHRVTEILLPCVSFDSAARDQKLAIPECNQPCAARYPCAEFLFF